MGQTVLAAVVEDPETTPVAGVDYAASQTNLKVPGLSTAIPLAQTADALPDGIHAQVLIDFSVAEATMPAVSWAATHGVNFVVGTTGISPDAVKEMGALADKYGVGGMVASNFALGAVVMMYFAEKAAPFFDYAEIVETHHQTKVDAPSGTAITTAQMIRDARGSALQRNVAKKETIAGTRGAEVGGVTIHSVRLPGTMAHQEVVFGAAGQTLTIRHDTIDRACYGPGILLAVKHVVKNKGLVTGLDRLLRLKG